MANDFNDLCDSGISYPLAAEIGRQLANGIGNPDKLGAVGLNAGPAMELASQINAGVFSNDKLARAMWNPSTAVILAALGNAGIAPFQAAAFGPIKQKLANSQNVVIFVNGDSTAYNTQGPLQLFLQQLAQKYSGTAALILWGEWNNGTGQPTNPKVYNSAVNTVYGAGPTVTMYLCALPGSVPSFPWDSSRKAAALDALPTPDLIILHQGHNAASFDVQAGTVTSGDNLVTGRGILLGAIGMMSLQWPNVPQLMTTQNPDRADNAMANMYGAYSGVAAALPSLSRQDTYADFIALEKATRLFRPASSDPTGVHPSDGFGGPAFDGATLQANRLMRAFNLTPAGSNSTISWPANSGTNLLANGDFSAWTGTFPDNCSAFNSQGAVKDASVKYGAAAYSMRMDCTSQFGSIRYTLTTAEKAAIANSTVSLAVLFRTTATYSGGANPFRAVFIVYNAAQAAGAIQWVQGDAPVLISGNWYLAVFPGVQIGTPGASTSVNLYPNFPNTPTGGSAWVQKLMLVQGSLPSGPFP